MDIALNRRAGVPLREQLAAQIEIQILDGALAPGGRLPSVRELARRLRLHPNTVSAAYRRLQGIGRVTLRRGAGVFVVARGGPSLETASDLDEMIRVALSTAFRRGFTVRQVRQAVRRWLKATPPSRVLVADTSLGMAELLAHELRAALSVPVEACALDDLEREPERLEGTLGVTLPYHIDRLRKLRSSAAVEAVTLEIPAADRQILTRLPPGSIVLVVSHSPTVLPFASKLIQSLRGDELLVETRLLADRSWRRLVPAADVAFADALSLEKVRAASPRRLREVRFLPPRSLERVRGALLAALSPRPSPGADGPAAP